jgi:hypothetical protein
MRVLCVNELVRDSVDFDNSMKHSTEFDSKWVEQVQRVVRGRGVEGETVSRRCRRFPMGAYGRARSGRSLR